MERLLIPLADDNGRLVTILGVVYTDFPDEHLAQFAENGPAFFIPSKTKKDERAPAHSTKNRARPTSSHS
jgi:hypothetical protein